MNIRTITPRAINDIQLTTLSPTQWTVCDTRIPRDDASSVLGYVEKTNNGYELMELSDPVTFHFCDSLTAAMAYFADALPRRSSRVQVPTLSA
jgi:hypothetical protein